MAGYKRFTVATDIKVYFCDPHHPWQRGSNENTNGLFRQYLPKGADMSVYSQAKLNAVARRLTSVRENPELRNASRTISANHLLHPSVESAVDVVRLVPDVSVISPARAFAICLPIKSL
jgi:hypothetical protein